MNTFAAARGDKTAMRPFAEILRPLVVVITACEEGVRVGV